MHFDVKNPKKIFPSCAFASINAQMYFNMGVYDRRIEIRRFRMCIRRLLIILRFSCIC